MWHVIKTHSKYYGLPIVFYCHCRIINGMWLLSVLLLLPSLFRRHIFCVKKNESYMFTRLSIFYIHRIFSISINKKNKKHSELKYGKAHQTTSALHERLFGDWQTTLSIQMHILGLNKLSVYDTRILFHTNLISHESAFIERKLNKDLIIIIYTEKKFDDMCWATKFTRHSVLALIYLD